MAEVTIETTLLTLLGALAGLALGAAGIRLLAALGSNRLPLGAQVHFDARVAIVALVTAVAVGLVMAAPIAWYSLRTHAAGTLQSHTRGATASRTAQRLRHGFLVAQIALSFVLLAGAGLLAVSLLKVMAVSPGFEAAHVLTGQVSLPWERYSQLERAPWLHRPADGRAAPPARYTCGRYCDEHPAQRE